MNSKTAALFIGIAWFVLLILYFLIRAVTKDGLVKNSPQVPLTGKTLHKEKPGSVLAKTGVLFIFFVNIITFGIVFASAISPAMERYLSVLRIALPGWLNILGSVLFVLDYVWGFFALIFNPNYTPLYKSSPHLVLATRGPYSLIRHPRYASEALLNIILFLFTGIWLPLLGLIAWVAIYYQAQAEEKFLLEKAPVEYGRYRKNTGMFFPKITKGRE